MKRKAIMESIFACFVMLILSTSIAISDNNGKDYTNENINAPLNNFDYPPVARFNWTPQHPTIFQIVTFNGSESYEPFGFIKEYYWSYTYQSSLPISMGYGEVIQYIWNQPGTYNVTLRVKDDDDQTGYKTKSITISSNQAPTANFTWNANGLSVTFTCTSTDDGEITYRGWDFDNDSQFDDFGETVTHIFPQPDIYPVTLVIQDNEGLTASTTKDVEISGEDQSHLFCTGTLTWSNVQPSETVTGRITIQNNGDTYSTLNWEIDSYPDWGIWNFSQMEGFNLTPQNGSFVVDVSVVTPTEKNYYYSGVVTIKNKDDPSNTCDIPVSLATPKYKPLCWHTSIVNYLKDHSFIFQFLQNILYT